MGGDLLQNKKKTTMFTASNSLSWEDYIKDKDLKLLREWCYWAGLAELAHIYMDLGCV